MKGGGKVVVQFKDFRSKIFTRSLCYDQKGVSVMLRRRPVSSKRMGEGGGVVDPEGDVIMESQALGMKQRNKEMEEIMNINSLMPAEMLEKIFLLLPPSGIKAVVQVCKLWNNLGEAPFLWSWVRLQLTKKNLATGAEMLTCRRLQGIKSLTITDVLSSDELMLSMFGKETLKFGLDLSCIEVSHVEPGMLASAVAQLKMEKSETHRKSLQLEAALFSICGLSYALWAMGYGYGEPRLKTLDLRGNNISLVDSGLLARTVVTLEELNIDETFLTSEQAVDMFMAISRGSMLKKLTMGRNNLSAVGPERFAKTISKLEEVDISDTHLTGTQVNQLIKSIYYSKLKKLNIRDNDLSIVDPTLLAAIVVNTQVIDLNSTCLTEHQVKAIFLAMTKEFKLKKLNIGSNNLSSVEPRQMARSVNKLESVELHQANLTERQAEEILRHGLVQTCLKRLGIGTVNCEVDMYLVHQARSVFEDLDI